MTSKPHRLPRRLSAAVLTGSMLLLAHCAPANDDPAAAEATGEDAFTGVTPTDNEPDVAFEDDPSLAANGDAASGEAAPGAAAVCSATRPACPDNGNTSIKENAGLKPVDGCAFRLGDKNAWATAGTLVDRLAKQLKVVSVGEVLADANRDASAIDSLSRVENFKQGFRWNFADNTSTDWWPQGITGSGDADMSGLVDGKRVLAVSFYDKGDKADRKGVRIALADITNPKAVKYRFALLVNVRDEGGRTEIDPVLVHAGGVVWYGRYLYVPDTGRGLRVFDMDRILRVPDEGANVGFNAPTGKYSAGDYRYVIPQVNEYVLSGSCPIAFSFASLDRSTTPHSIVTGEYKSGNEGRLVRWYLDRQSNKLARPFVARDAFFAQQERIQGALSWKGTWWVQSAAQSLLNGELYRLKPNTPSRGFPQPPGIEDLYHDPTTGLLWSLTEFPGYRYVYAAPLSSY